MKKRSFLAGMLTMLLIMTLVVPAAATVGKVTKARANRSASGLSVTAASTET